MRIGVDRFDAFSCLATLMRITVFPIDRCRSLLVIMNGVCDFEERRVMSVVRLRRNLGLMQGKSLLP